MGEVSVQIDDKLTVITAFMALVRMAPAENRSPEMYYMKPLDFHESSKYQPSSNSDLFYPYPRKYDRSAESTKEQLNHPPETPEIPSNLTVPSSTQLPHPATNNDRQEPAEDHFKDSRLQQMVQQLYMAQGQVNSTSILSTLLNSSCISGSIGSSRNSTCPNGGSSSPTKS